MSDLIVGCISDTHNQLARIAPPVCDVLVHGGDMLGRGSPDELNQELRILVNRFAPKCKHIVVTAGNHDWVWQRTPGYAKEIFDQFAENARANHGCEMHYLQDKALEIEGKTFYGSPWQPEFCNWAFNLPRKSPEMGDYWKAIPDWVDVLITHSPPYGILDFLPLPYHRRNEDPNVGCEMLREEVEKRIKPQLHVFGHIHANAGVKVLGETIYVNAAICDEGYQTTRGAVLIHLSREDRTERSDDTG